MGEKVDFWIFTSVRPTQVDMLRARTHETKVDHITVLVWRNVTGVLGEGNICRQLECSKENKQFAAAASTSLLCPFRMRKTGVVEVNQFYICSRLEAVNSGPGSAIFQLLSKNMCSRYSYSSRASQFTIVFIACLSPRDFCVLSFSIEPGRAALH